MRGSTIGTKAISLVLNACLVLSPLLYARDASHADDGITWSGEIEPMVMRAYGYSPEVLRIWEIYVPEVDQEIDFDVTSIDNDLDNWKFAFRGEAEAMKNRWGVGVAGFQFDTAATLTRSETVSEVFPSAAEGPGDLVAYGWVSGPSTSGVVAFDDEEYFEGMALLRNGDGPVYGAILDDEEGMLDSMQNFKARTELDVWSTDIYGFHRLVDKETVNVDLRLGAKLGSLDVGTNTDHSLAPCGDSCHVGMKLDTSVKSKVLAGPYLAASATARFGRVRVEGQLAQSVLFGDVDYQTRVAAYWTDGETDSFSRSVVDRSKSVTMPVTEVDLKVLYDLNEFFSAGIGMYAGVWWNARVPTNSTPGTVESEGPPQEISFVPTSADTGLNQEHITFMGVLATLEMRFFGP